MFAARIHANVVAVSFLLVGGVIGTSAAFLFTAPDLLRSPYHMTAPGTTIGPLSSRRRHCNRPFVSLASSGKGFGGSNTPSSEPSTGTKKKKNAGQASTETVLQERKEEAMNPGQKALAELRRQRAEQKDAELRKIRELRQLDGQLQEGSTTPAIPEPVAQRMGKRMLPFVGVPLFLSMGSFVAFWYFATYKNVEFQPGMVAGVSAGLLVVGLLVGA